MTPSLRRARAWLLAAALTAVPGAAGAEDTPPVPPAADAPPPPAEDPVAAEKRKRLELDARRGTLPPGAAREAMALLDRFRDKNFRVWGGFRREVVAIGPGALPALAIALEETDWETRAFAASCLGEIGDPTAAGILGDAYGREKYTEGRRQAVLALARLRTPSARPALARAAGDEDLGVRLAAVHGIARLADPGDADLLRTFASDADLDLRYAARGALAALGDEETIASLLAETERHVDRKSQDAASFVVEDNADRYGQYLLGIALARSTDRRVEKAALAALSARKPYEKKDFLRMGVAVGLGREAADAGVARAEPLLDGLLDKDDDVRVACSYGLGFVGAKEIVPRVAKALTDGRMDVRFNAVVALGRAGGEDAAAALRRALGDRADEVRLGAVRALGLVRNGTATKALVHAVRDEKYMVRVLAVRQLASRTHEEGVLEALSRAADDADYGVREAAIAALAHHPAGADVAPRIVAALQDPDFGVQANACLALAKIGESAPELASDAAAVRRVVGLYLASPPARRKLVRAAQECLDALRPAPAVEPLLEGLTADAQETRRRAKIALLTITEKSGLPYDPDAPKSQRDAAARAWREWWGATKTLPPRGPRRHAVTGDLADVARDLKWKGLDIALLLDSTFSMNALLNASKERLDELASELAELLPSVRVSVYTYRDRSDDYVYYGTPLTYDTWKPQGFLQYAEAGGGGDLPEAVYDTVRNCAENLKWRPGANKVVVYAGDAAHHREQEAEFLQFVRSWFTADRQATLHALFTDTKRRSLDVKARKRREEDAATYPVLEDFRRATAAGRGRALALDDESALIKDLLVLTFGEEWRPEVENLLDFER